MPKVSMPMADWDTVVMILTDALSSGRFAYFSHIIDDIANQLEKQEA